MHREQMERECSGEYIPTYFRNKKNPLPDLCGAGVRRVPRLLSTTMSTRSKNSGSVMARIKQPGSEEAKRLVQQKSYYLFVTSYEPNICLVMKKSMIFPMTPDKAYAKPSIING